MRGHDPGEGVAQEAFDARLIVVGSLALMALGTLLLKLPTSTERALHSTSIPKKR